LGNLVIIGLKTFSGKHVAFPLLILPYEVRFWAKILFFFQKFDSKIAKFGQKFRRQKYNFQFSIFNFSQNFYFLDKIYILGENLRNDTENVI